MNVVAAISQLFAEPPSEVTSIVAGVPKSLQLIAAERTLRELPAAQLVLSKRRAAIFERLNIQSPLQSPLFKSEQDALEAERADIDRQARALIDRAAALRGEIAVLMPAHARNTSVAFSGFRRRAAEQLIDAVAAIEQALADIAESNKVLTAAGMSPPAAFTLPYSKALRGLAERVLLEKYNG